MKPQISPLRCALVEKHIQERSVELQIPRLPRISCRCCGFGQGHVVLLGENHISGAGESCEVGNPGTLGMTKERVVGFLKVVAGPEVMSAFRSVTTLYAMAALSFVIPSEAEGSAVSFRQGY
jgi:hypothetical protein